ncbi:hypothetical protein CI109_106872 [Kwoniella shandongensis]|uniref:Uncharacterized protein n=1 Tax=Kwoniella shandongensis TaxID=1734106 RepID=A0A5M6CAA8_9TREE|nr:uncharacterized protein CI109_000872 [Kwoniella shandongensis]KAA5530692.1 hypothetical protein CI109_000872 [Kwoniella shandongensis]
MSDIQSISIISTKTVDVPKLHTVYVIQITTPTRTWTVDRRYNDFVALHAELKSSTGKEPPSPLPQKHWNLMRSLGDEKTIRERRLLLEQYLRSILSTKTPIFRQAYTFSDFLSLPTSSTSASNAHHAPSSSFTAQSWLLEHTAIQTLLRSARSALLKRDALASMSDPSGSRSAGVEAKRTLKEVETRIGVLETGLKGLVGSLGEGERKRREEMVEGLRVEKLNLGRMAEAGVKAGSGSAFSSRSSPSPSSSAFAPTSSASSMPGALPQSAAPGRVFGSKPPPQETSTTRPLDDRGLLQLQQTQMGNQDEQLKELSNILQRQRKMGEVIHQEIEEQNELLDEVESGVDKTGRKLGKAKREMNRLG